MIVSWWPWNKFKPGRISRKIFPHGMPARTSSTRPSYPPNNAHPRQQLPTRLGSPRVTPSATSRVVAQLHERVFLRGHRPRFRAFPRERWASTANHRCYSYRVGVWVYATHHIRQNIHEYGRIARNIRTGTGDGHELHGNYHLPFYSRNFTGNILHGCLLFPVFI